MVYGSGPENRRCESARGFESLSHRQPDQVANACGARNRHDDASEWRAKCAGSLPADVSVAQILTKNNNGRLQRGGKRNMEQ